MYTLCVSNSNPAPIEVNGNAAIDSYGAEVDL